MTAWQDVLYHVFHRLPAYIVCRFKCVGKRVDYTRIPRFCEEQADHMLSVGDLHIFTSPVSDYHQVTGLGLHNLLEDGPAAGVPTDFFNVVARSGKILSSWNGLIVVRFRRKKVLRLLICNPVTSSWAPLRTRCGEYDANANVNIIIIPATAPTRNDYRLLSVTRQNKIFPPYVLKEYNQIADQWQVLNPDMNLGDRKLNISKPAIVNEWIYFMSDNYHYMNFIDDATIMPYIMAYSLTDHTSVRLDLPNNALEYLFHGSYGVFTWGCRWTSQESLCLVRFINSSFTLFTCAAPTSQNSSWVQILHVTMDDLVLSAARSSPNSIFREPIRWPYTVVNGNCLIFATREKIYGYNINGPYPWKLRQLGINDSRTNINFIPYSSTFRRCRCPHPSSFKKFLANNY